MQYRRIREMKDVVKPVTIAVCDVIGQRISDEDAVPLKVALAAAALVDPNPEFSRQLLFASEILVEIKISQIGRRGLQKCASRFPDIATRHVRKS